MDGVIKTDKAQCVRKTRVSSRKLRAALPLFQLCFPRKKFKKWAMQIKEVTRLLGDERDLDVQIGFVKDYIKKIDPEEKKILKMLLRDRQSQREKVHPSVIKGLRKLKESNILVGISSFCGDTIAEQSKSVFDPNQVLEKAYWQMAFRLDRFLSLGNYVHMEREVQRHHEMRINAKKLRYTIEFFAPLYTKDLKVEIGVVKKYQDILGEKHDLEVWIDYVPKFMARTKVKLRSKTNKETDPDKFKKTMLSFLKYIKQQRKLRYKEFVNLWGENKKSGFFDKLREKTVAGPTMAEERAKQVLTNPDVKLAVFSDVHANLQALEAVLHDAEERGADVFLNAGDSIGYGACPNEVVELLSEKNVLSVVGNYDLEVIEGKSKSKGEKKTALEFTRKELAKSAESYLCFLPRQVRLEVAGKRLFMTHGSPDSIEEHIYHDTPREHLKKLADAVKADVIVVGHSHEQYSKEIEGARFVNPGSVGRPSDGDPRTGYAILTFNPFDVELIRLNYDVISAAQTLREKGLPESFAQMILRGVSLDTVVEEDRVKQDAMIKNCGNNVEASRREAQKCWPDTEHFRQVTNVALGFFDGLVDVHKLGQRERCWLECAATLHDVGLSKSGNGHHKKSAQIILDDTQLPFSSTDRRVIASIARYHRKGVPKQSHYNLLTLNRDTLHKVKMLASLLRVADALDYTHESNVKSFNFKIAPKKIVVECSAGKRSLLEEEAFNKKKDLFERMFARKLVLAWKQQ